MIQVSILSHSVSCSVIFVINTQSVLQNNIPLCMRKVIGCTVHLSKNDIILVTKVCFSPYERERKSFFLSLLWLATCACFIAHAMSIHICLYWYKWPLTCTWRGWLSHSFNILISQCCKFMLVNFVYSQISIFNDTSEGDQYLDWCVGHVFPCSSRLPKDGTPVPKHTGVWYLSWIVFYWMRSWLLTV